MNNLFRGTGVLIELPDDETFLKIKETLTRIGIASKKDNVLYQSCHILHKQGTYAILHFKELFQLDGKETNFTDEDKVRRNAIVGLLQQWNLLKIIDQSFTDSKPELINLKIVSFKDKSKWSLKSKYTIGK